MRIYRAFYLLIIAMMANFDLNAQVRFPVTKNDLRNNLEKIISDYPYGFGSLKGDTLYENPQTIEFASRLDFKTAEENSITEYKSAHPVYSWSATLLTTEDFNEASTKYSWLNNQLKVMSLTFQGSYSYSLTGSPEPASETRKFSSGIFSLMPRARDLPKIKIETSITFEFPEWKVKLMVYEKEREDDERGNPNGE
ncbi:MAG: hypothetical protein ACJ75F_14875 [Flavisolibacter sp.]|jgi:hypothetical protein